LIAETFLRLLDLADYGVKVLAPSVSGHRNITMPVSKFNYYLQWWKQALLAKQFVCFYPLFYLHISNLLMKKVYAFLFVLAAIVATNRGFAQVDIFMKLTDRNGNMINGDSQVPNYIGWSELLSTGTSLLAPIVNGAGGGVGVGRAYVDTFPIQMRLNSVSIPITQYLLAGITFNAVDFSFRKSSSATSCSCAYYKIHMESVLVNNVINAVDTSGVTQQINFLPRRVAWAYYKPDANGNIPTTPTNSYSWDFGTYSTFPYTF
jgi:type VI protein secretion system component Hcp